MDKPVNLTASTAHSQHAELQTLLGAQAPVVTDEEAAAKIAELTAKLDAADEYLGDAQAKHDALQTDFDALKESNAQLVAAFEAEKEAHAKTSAALAAATQPAA